MARRLTGQNPLAYIGVDPVNPTQAVIYTRNPTVNDYDNFTLQCQWLNSSTQQVWILVSKADFVATWKEFTGGGGSGGIQTITGDAGGAVGPDLSNNIDLQGGGPYVFTGNPGANLLTLSDDGTLAYTYTTDSGVATPSSNNLNVIGSGIISTSAVGDTVTITAAGSVPVSIVVDVGGPVTPAGGVLDVLGGNNITTSGAGNTITVDVTGTTDHAVQIGNATGSLDSIAIGTDGQVLLGATGADPAFATLTSGDGSITFTVGPNSLDLKAAGAGPGVTTIDADSGSCAPAGGILNVFGGENITTSAAGNTLTAKVSGTAQYAPQMGSATGGLDDVGIMTTGELMIGVTGSAPNLARLLAGANIAIDDTSSPGNITISSSGGGGGGIIKTTFTASDTWIPNAQTEYVYLQIWSGGGGGASGTSGNGTPSSTGVGGCGGSCLGGSFFFVPRSSFGATAAVTIGVGGSGGASVTSAGTGLYGNDGLNGSLSSVDDLVGGLPGSSTIATLSTPSPTFIALDVGGSGGSPSGSFPVTAPGAMFFNTAPFLSFYGTTAVGGLSSVDNGGGQPSGFSQNNVRPYLVGVGGTYYFNQTLAGAPTSGGGGGGVISGTPYAGGRGGGIWNASGSYSVTGAAGAAASSGLPGTNGSDASAVASNGIFSGGLGGGGGANSGANTNGTAGGNGGFPGGGGGGGGGCSLGFTSGAGGDGADGYVVIYEFISGSGSSAFTWVVVTVDTAMSNNIGYIANSGSLITFTLPATASVGDIIRVTGKGSGGWTIAQNVGQFIQYGSIVTTTGVGGSLSSNDPADTVELVCVTANTEWLVLSSVGTLIYV